MREQIEKLTEIAGIRGVAVLTKDGLIIDKLFYDSESSDIIGAMVAKICKEMENTIGKATDEIPIFSSIYAEKGEVVFLAKEKFIIMIYAEKNVNIGALTIQVKSVAAQLTSMI